jgi:AcrR family transcriptional regulator
MRQFAVDKRPKSSTDVNAGSPRASAGMTRRAEKSLETRTRILDAAEELFSKHGVSGVTLRDIAQLADVDTALLHYYFDAKRGIFEAVLARRAAILHYETVEGLSRYEREAQDNVTIEGAIGAYVRPIFRLGRTGGREWRNYCALVLQLANNEEWAAETVATYFDPMAMRLVEVMRKALPTASDADLHWCYQLLAKALTLTFALDGGIERLSGGACRAGDLDALEPRMVRFVAAGIGAACTSAAVAGSNG